MTPTRILSHIHRTHVGAAQVNICSKRRLIRPRASDINSHLRTSLIDDEELGVQHAFAVKEFGPGNGSDTRYALFVEFTPVRYANTVLLARLVLRVVTRASCQCRGSISWARSVTMFKVRSRGTVKGAKQLTTCTIRI